MMDRFLCNLYLNLYKWYNGYKTYILLIGGTMNILIAEDNKDMLKVINNYFINEGFNTYIAENGETALEIFCNTKIDVAILDWMMPKLSGIEVLKEMKLLGDIKVIMLTAKSEIEDELNALGIGADDYLRKPFDPRVLILRVKKLLGFNADLKVKHIKIDTKSNIVYKDDQCIKLTSTAFNLLKYLVINKNRILSKNMILNNVWGLDYEGTDRTVDTHIRRLREKIGDAIITTHRGMGYSIDD